MNRLAQGSIQQHMVSLKPSPKLLTTAPLYIVDIHIYLGLILFQVSKSAIYREFYLVGSMAGLVEWYRESYQCIPAIRSNVCALSREQHLG